VALEVGDPVTDSSLGLSLLSAALFAAGFCMARFRGRPRRLSAGSLDVCEDLAYKATLVLFAPAIGVAAALADAPYGAEGDVPLAAKAMFYLHLFFGFLFLGVARADGRSKRRVWMAAAMIALPRILVSVHFGREFLAQGVVPILFLAVARGFLPLTRTRLSLVAALGLWILFVPSLTRGDPVFGGGAAEAAGPDLGDAAVPAFVSWISGGSSLQVTQDYMNLDLDRRCPPLLVSLTAKLVPYGLLHVCTVSLSGREMAASLDRLVTWEANGADGSMRDGGVGTSYLLELYLTGGMAAVIVGSFGFGWVCRFFAVSMAGRSLFCGVWADCLMRAVWSPRCTLGYVYERVPGLLLASLLVLLIARQLRGRPRGYAVEVPAPPSPLSEFVS
jgi:hypothetical protein